jgi:nickel-dependent lactate racemase
MVFYQKGAPDLSLNNEDLKNGLYTALEKLGSRKKVILLPPDFTRFHSRAGELTGHAFNYYQDKIKNILPALGTHFPMTSAEIREMFPGIPENIFRAHDFRNGFKTVGTVPADYIQQISENAVDFSWPAQISRLVADGGYDLILSIGQVVPHEVAGMASYNKNIFVGTGGAEGINKSHFLGAAYGMERIMGRAKNPVRDALNYASNNFTNHLPIIYVLTVIGRDEQGKLVPRGLFVGDDLECFNQAAELSLQVNFTMLDQPLKKVVVNLDPAEFKTTWLGNKSIYRTRMAIADDGELIVLAPGLKQFGEDAAMDQLIRKYGYVGTPQVLNQVAKNEDLQQNLGAAAHLIHGSSEGRFSITYCPGQISKQEIESVNFKYADLAVMQEKYDPAKLQDGMNIMPDGEEIFYISNPAIGLWAFRDRFHD